MATAVTPPEEIEVQEREFIEQVWNGREYDRIEETHTDDYVGHWLDVNDGALDRDGLEAFIRSIHDGFSDFRMDVEFVLVDDDMVAVGFTGTGTHDGEFMGIPPTERTGAAPGIYVHRADEDGMIVEGWAVWDAFGQLQQLGVVPEEFTLASFLETGANLAKQDVLKLAKGK